MANEAKSVVPSSINSVLLLPPNREKRSVLCCGASEEMDDSKGELRVPTVTTTFGAVFLFEEDSNRDGGDLC